MKFKYWLRVYLAAAVGLSGLPAMASRACRPCASAPPCVAATAICAPCVNGSAVYCNPGDGSIVSGVGAHTWTPGNAVGPTYVEHTVYVPELVTETRLVTSTEYRQETQQRTVTV